MIDGGNKVIRVKDKLDNIVAVQTVITEGVGFQSQKI